MDVDSISFLPRLLQILENLSKCQFVSIDLELSGVTSRTGVSRNKQSLQARYAETKEAAQRYQILQVGLTFSIEEGGEAPGYVLKTYNIPISPIFEEDLDIERIFSFQSGAVDFLLKNGFDLMEPFKFGVPYLSRDEEKLAKQRMKERDDKSRFTDMEIKDDDVQSKEFVRKIHQEIGSWLETAKPDSNECIITSRTTPSLECDSPNLTAFDKRLVHQVIRADYPGFISKGISGAVVVKRLNEEREKEFQKERRRKTRARIAKQIGFRWIIEALTGGSLHNIDLAWFAKDPVSGSAIFFDKQDYSSRFNRAAKILKEKKPVLVGHNLFTDLVYIYQAFIGTLPDTIEEFRVLLYDLFPVIVDTKYMATHNCGDINPASSLDQIEEVLRVESVPRIDIHKDHGKYVENELFHEAGYDSFLTARIMILLSAKLEASGT